MVAVLLFAKLVVMAVPLIMQWLVGTWFIIASDAPIWLKGDKESPTLNYTVVEQRGNHKMLDETKYTKNSKRKVIAGYDKADNSADKAFVWRGKGALFFVTSKWRVVMQDKRAEWAVIAYSKTLFTPEGVDIMCRKPTLSESTLAAIRNGMLKDSMLARHVDKLKLIKQQ